ncbi:MAG: hypothetical protein HQL52_02495 [Magnetococcales bacterium]|nr:hypothetical protein [Magnetococcales bacterium]
MAAAITLHLLAAVFWVGSMFFAHVVVRPSSQDLELTLRVKLWTQILGRFFVVVWCVAILLPASGYWMVVSYFGGFTDLALHVIIMQGLGWTMIVIFVSVFFSPYQHLKRMIRQELFPEAGMYILRIRKFMLVNLILGIMVVLTAVSGRFL